VFIVSVPQFHSHAFRNRWHLIAPDFPGYSAMPDRSHFAYTFDGYADFLQRFTKALNLTRYGLYLHDYRSQIGLRLAMIGAGAGRRFDHPQW
jgi:pimeloyl-ACP methyl ester carboxylesterase